MAPATQTDVLVSGAGPVGMFAALCLSDRGLRTRIVDKYRRTALHSYALALHPQTLRMLDAFGAAEELIDRGQKIERIVIRNSEDVLAEIDLSVLEEPFPFVLVLSQPVLEAVLERRLAADGIDIEWRHSVLNFDTDADGVSTLVVRMPVDSQDDTGDGIDPDDLTTQQIRSSFLIGADGYDSLTRRLLDLDYGRFGSTMAYALVEFDAPLEAPDRMNVVLGDRSADALWPLAPRRGRWNVQLADRDASADIPDVKELLRARAPWFDGRFDEIHWTTSISFERRLAASFGLERVWLAGDAAHMTSPIGVHAMNVSFREVGDLAQRLAAIVDGKESPGLLLHYDEERRQEWEPLLGVEPAERLPGAPGWIDSVAERVVSSIPASGPDLNRLLAQVGLRIPDGQA